MPQQILMMHLLVGIRMANTSSAQITVDVAIANDSNTVQACKNSYLIPVGGALELIDGGSKMCLTIRR